MGVQVWLWCYLHRDAFLPWTAPHPETSSFIPSYTQLGLGEAMTGGPASEVGMGRHSLLPTPKQDRYVPSEHAGGDYFNKHFCTRKSVCLT